MPVYKRLGIRKKYYSPISSKDFRNVNSSLLKSNLHLVKPEKTVLFNEADEETRRSILNFRSEGFVILKNYLSDTQVNVINEEIENLIVTKKVKFKYGNRIMFAINKSNILRNFGINPELLELLSSLMDGDAKLFQSINFLMGSEQHTHSDSIHMTTFPLGGLLGVWIALEDINEDNGPLHYYPGSHKLPYYLNADYDNEGNYLMIGNKDYSEYEKMLEKKIVEHNIQKQIFTAKKGDLLIWHANLMHGGEPHINKEKTRKSMVLHYFNTNCVCYHEITQRPSLM